MTNEEKAEKIEALAGEAAEFSKELSDDDLEQVAGGAFNSEVVNRLNLDVRMGAAGAQGLSVKLNYAATGGASGAANAPMVLGENTIRKLAARPGELSIAVRNYYGDWISLSRSELNELLS
ncbi:MAG: hypothetical protein LBK98_05225 [Peptococcaceae bacterium]|jgi:hypothetical protein|nr:hypothetical protein [Peptococcaceae bacterium]